MVQPDLMSEIIKKLPLAVLSSVLAMVRQRGKLIHVMTAQRCICEESLDISDYLPPAAATTASRNCFERGSASIFRTRMISLGLTADP